MKKEILSSEGMHDILLEIEKMATKMVGEEC